MRHYPFHYSFFVKDLESSRDFYGNLLGLKEGRSTDTWVDFDFFGNQVSFHVSNIIPEPVPYGVVDTVIVPVPHFGCILPWDEFQMLADKLTAAKTEFIIKPTVRFAGLPEEQATMFFSDPSGNSLEMKSFRKPERLFTK